MTKNDTIVAVSTPAGVGGIAVVRASGADDKVKIVPPIVFSLEEALEYIKADEYVEITPNHIRMRKIILDELERKRIAKQNGQDED